MATDSRNEAELKADQDDPMRGRYDRSSLVGNFTVMIAGQTEDDYRRRAPLDRPSEYVDGVVHLHPAASDLIDPSDPRDPMKQWYDRSSLAGDFMVMIAGQTEAEYLRRCPEGRFCEFIDGVVFMPSPVALWHQFEIQFLAYLLQSFTSRRWAGIVLTGPAALKVRPGCLLEPDLFVMPPGGEAQFHRVYCDPPAPLVVEVLSKSTRSHDLKLKSALYRGVGTIEVWFVDERKQVLIIHRQTDEGFEVERINSGPYLSRAVPGFWIDASWLWARPMPDMMECSQIILAGPPA